MCLLSLFGVVCGGGGGGGVLCTVIDILNFGLTWIGLDIDLVFEKHTWIGKGFSSSFLAQHG